MTQKDYLKLFEVPKLIKATDLDEGDMVLWYCKCVSTVTEIPKRETLNIIDLASGRMTIKWHQDSSDCILSPMHSNGHFTQSFSESKCMVVIGNKYS